MKGHLMCGEVKTHRPFGVIRLRASTQIKAVPEQRFDQSRRLFLGSLATLVAIPVQQANAGFGWDGSSAAYGSCAIGEDGADCRRNTLLKDSDKKAAYPSSQQEGRPQSNSFGLPVAEMSDEYSKQTALLGETVERYFTLEAFDPARPKLVKEIKTDGAAWAAKYARGGSARKLSARKFYIVVDALQGHFTSNGLSPLPQKKIDILRGNVEETKALLAKVHYWCEDVKLNALRRVNVFAGPVTFRMSGYKTVPNQVYATLPGGAKLPVVGLGTWKSKPDEAEKAVEHALRVGYRHIDCADAYGNHEGVGQAFKKVFSDSDGVKREDVWITTKLNNPDHEPSGVEGHVKRFLKELQLDYLDCVLIHWPYQEGCKGKELKPSYKSTWQALEACVDKGLVKHIGISNVSVKKWEDILTYNKKPVVINQVEINPYWRNDKLHKFADSKGLHLSAYSPLGTPDSAESMGNKDRPKIMEDPVIVEIAKKYNKNPGQILIRWGIQNGTSLLPKSANPERIESNLHVFDWSLDKEDFEKISSFKDQRRFLRGTLAIDPEGPYPNEEALWDGEV